MDDDICEHCYPEKAHHFKRKFFRIFDYFIFYPFIYVIRRALLLSENDVLRMDNLLNQLTIQFFQKFKIFTKTNVIDRSQFNDSQLAIWDGAQRLGINLYNFKENNLQTSYFMFVFKTKQYYFMQTPTTILYQKDTCFDNDVKYDNKWILKKKLLTNNIPCPEGMVFISNKNAYKYGIKLGFPLTVKPVSSSLSIHVFSNIQTDIELKEAIKIVKQIDFQVLVEKHVPGNVYRSLIINDSLIGCVMRQPRSVIGDGVHTILELINEQNKTIKNKDSDKFLFKTTPDSYLMRTLKDQGVNLQTILKKGQSIFISKKVTMGSSAKISNATDLIHPENKLLLERVHKLLNIPLSGLDFICQDISIPWNQQQFGIIENNSFPYIDMHLHPSDGKAIDVSSKIWNYILFVLNQKNS